MSETFTDMVARMRDANWAVGDRVEVNGRMGTVEARCHQHTGWRVRWDEPQFGAEVSNVRAVNMHRPT